MNPVLIRKSSLQRSSPVLHDIQSLQHIVNCNYCDELHNNVARSRAQRIEDIRGYSSVHCTFDARMQGQAKLIPRGERSFFIFICIEMH